MTHVDQLAPILEALDELLAAPIIGEGPPEDWPATLSVRDDLLGLTDLVSGDDSAPRVMTRQERFRSRLTRESSRVYDADGNYLGQGIRFALDEWDLNYWACAERGWYLMADVVGTGLSAGRTAVIVLKSNTFYSQRCDQPMGSGSYQVSSVRLRHNPFLSEPSTVATEVRGRYASASPWS